MRKVGFAIGIVIILIIVLKATNGQTIGKSEVCPSVSAMENRIQSVKKNGPVAQVEENTTAEHSPSSNQGDELIQYGALACKGKLHAGCEAFR
jgi:uncharacterized protein YegP (UPF0339 family)